MAARLDIRRTADLPCPQRSGQWLPGRIFTMLLSVAIQAPGRRALGAIAPSRQRGQMTLRSGLAHGLIAAAAMLLLLPPAQAQQSSERTRVAQAPGGGGAQPTLLGTYGDWGAY